MKYFALYDDGGTLITFGTTSANTVKGEITAEEYEALKAEHTAKLDYAQQVYDGTIAINDVPEEYRAAVAAMVKEMQIQPEETMADIDEALAILHGEVSEQ